MADRADIMLLLDMMLSENGTPLTAPLRDAARRRGNIPGDIEDQFSFPGHPDEKVRLWVVDRILEPQTIAHFMEFLGLGHLPGNRQSSLPLLTGPEVVNITKPYSTWAPTPFNRITRPAVQSIMVRIGSFEDPARLICIAKELHAMKSRIWEGILPLSERRWKDLNLDDPENFHIACRYIASVINVFHYFNHSGVSQALRETFNLISDHLREAEQALNAARRLASADGAYQRVSLTDLWYEFMRAHYDDICSRAHHWVIEHVQRLRAPILEQLANHRPGSRHDYDTTQWALGDALHDLAENASQADSTIFIPTDGYKGDPQPAAASGNDGDDAIRGFLVEPVVWSPSLYRRRNTYNARVRFLSRQEMYSDPHYSAPHLRGPSDDSSGLMVTARSQITAQARARKELRGEEQPPGLDPWVVRVRQRVHNRPSYGYVVYRLSHSNPEKWDDFKTKFEADISNWGREISDIDDVREVCKLHWLDGQDLEIKDGDIEAAKKHFNTYVKSEDVSNKVHSDVLLVIDDDVMKSYLDQAEANLGFVLVVEANYEPSEEDDESPGYSGTLRVLGSLLWDDLGAMLVTQGPHLVDLWPLAMSHPNAIYMGPRVTQVFRFTSSAETTRWELANALFPSLVRYMISTNRR